MKIDWWTLGFQVVNALVLIWLLRRFFWRPLAAVIQQRRAAAQATLSEADARRGEAAAALADVEKTRAGFRAERDAILAKARKDAEQLRTTRLAEAAEEAKAAAAAAKAAIAKDREAADRRWTEQASQLAVEIAGRLAARLDGPAVRATFLDWLLKEIPKLAEPTRQAEAASAAPLEAVTAKPLEPGEQERYRKLIIASFGSQPRIDFRDDPALIAGLELHGDHFVVSNSWRADLDKILADLTHDT